SDTAVIDEADVDDVEEDVNVVGFDAALVDVDECGEVVVSGVVVSDVVVVEDVAVDDVEEDVNVVVMDAVVVDNVAVVDVEEDVE
ncbi:unnamed protein product, partial [Rotaria sp. Silwood2]